jgi:hypothetical protein
MCYCKVALKYVDVKILYINLVDRLGQAVLEITLKVFHSTQILFLITYIISNTRHVTRFGHFPRPRAGLSQQLQFRLYPEMCPDIDISGEMSPDIDISWCHVS